MKPDILKGTKFNVHKLVVNCSCGKKSEYDVDLPGAMINERLLKVVKVLARFGLSKYFGYVLDNAAQRITKDDCELARTVLKEVEGSRA